MQKLLKKICGIGLALAMCTTGINCGFVSAAQGDNVTFNGSVDTGNPTGNAVDGDMGTYFIINNTSVNSKIINIKFAESYKGMSIYSGQEGVWPDYLSASADVYVKVGEEFIKTDSINGTQGSQPELVENGKYVHKVSFGGYSANEVEVRFTGDASGWQRIREIVGDKDLTFEGISVIGMPVAGNVLSVKTNPSVVTGVEYSWKIDGEEVSSESSYKIKTTDTGSISVTVTYDGKEYSSPSYVIMSSYSESNGVSITGEDLNESLNGENLDLAKAIDGDTGTMANINNTTDLQGKSVTVEFEKAMDGLKIVSGNNGDKLTVDVDVYLSTDGEAWGDSPAAVITEDSITDDGSTRTNQIVFENPEGAKFVKLVFKENSITGWTRIREITALNGVENDGTAVVSNLAVNASVTASGNETDDFKAENVNDGNLETRWSSASIENNDQWIQLKFDEPVTFNNIKLYWETSAGKEYKIQTSDDGQAWNDLISVTDGQKGETRAFGFQPVTAQYVRVYVTENYPDVWNCVSIYEIEIFNNSWSTILDGTLAEIDALTGLPNIQEDVSLITKSSYGADITWSENSDYLIVEDGVLKVTKPETTAEAELTAKISYNENEYDYVIKVKVLSQQDIDNTYDINPTPHSLVMNYKTIDFDNVKVFYETGITEVTKSRVNEIMEKQGVAYEVVEDYSQSTLALGIKDSAEAVDQNTAGYDSDLFTAAETKYDIHYIDINENGRVTILGEDDEAVYYGLATLDEAMTTVDGQQLSCAEVEDYSNMQYRGIVEGFYGKVYTVEDILSLFDYMEENKMNTFVYGPKGDPYHLGNWRDEYPTEITEEERFYGQMTQDDMRTIAAKAAENNISFVWSIHPAMQNGIDFTNRESVEKGIEDILVKFDHMYDLGIRQFGVFVDDINLSTALTGSENQAYMIAELQKRLEEKYNNDSDETKHIKGTFYVPSFYGLDFGTDAQLTQNLGAFKKANEGNNVIMMMTGAGCWSSVTNDSLLRIRNYTGKKPVMWWNYPVNDNIDDQLYMNRLNSVYGTDLDVVDGMGILSNPMNQAEASKVSLYGVADYTWNTANFNAQENWEESFYTYTDDVAMAEALRTFASYASKDQDYTDIKSVFDKYRQDKSNYAEVQARMQEIIDACEMIETLEFSEDYKLQNLFEEIQPWVYRLRDMAKIINYSLEAIHGDETNKFTNLMSAINLYNGIDTAEIYKTESLEGQGTTQTISNYIVNPGYKNILPFAREIVTECNDSLFDEQKEPYVFTDTNTEGWELVKADSSYSADAQVTLKPGSYVEYELMALQTIGSISGLDTLEAQVSLDGKTWEAFESGVDARYVRILNTTDGDVELNLNTIKITLQTYGVSSITSSAQIYQPGTYPTTNIIDGNKTTFVWLYSQAVNTNLTMNFDSTRTINYVEFVTTTDGDRFVGKGKIEYLNEDGQWIVAGSINSDDFQDGATSITFEEVKAKGIRFVVTEAGSTNWLKVAEFNAANTNAKNIISVNGVGETKLNDLDMRTFVNPTGEGEVVYNVYESAKVNSLKLYNAAGQWDGVSVYAVTEDGETELAVVEDKSNVNTHVYDVSALKGVKSFRIAFTNGIYLNEIETESDRFVALNTYEVEKEVAAAKELSEKTTMYTEESLKVLKEKIAAVEALLADMAIGEPVTQDALDAAMADMAEAVNNLEEVEGAFKIGDVDHSGVVDIDDATLIQKYLTKSLGDMAFYIENADYSRDGKITIYDTTLIQLMLAS